MVLDGSQENRIETVSEGADWFKYSISFSVDAAAQRGLWPPHSRGFSRSHATTHHSRQDSSGRVISSSQKRLPDNTQHSQQTDIHAPGGFRTHDLSRRAAADLRLRPRLTLGLQSKKTSYLYCTGGGGGCTFSFKSFSQHFSS
jgi:hypothetical protein